MSYFDSTGISHFVKNEQLKKKKITKRVDGHRTIGFVYRTGSVVWCRTLGKTKLGKSYNNLPRASCLGKPVDVLRP